MADDNQKVLVWIFCRGAGVKRIDASFLVLKTTPARGGFWQPVTGSVETGESVENAALRELREETGFVPLRIVPVSRPYEFESRGKRVEEHPFLAEVAIESRDRVRLDSHEHVQWEWVSAEDALARVKHESNARVLREVLKMNE